VAPAEPAGAVDEVSDRILTVPNVLSMLRLLGVPLFLWLVLGPHADGLALLVLVFAGVSDYLDGKIARRYGLISRLGQILDPLADRLYIVATVIALTVRGIIPIWLAVALPGRDVLLATTLPILRRHGYGPLPVHFLGKAATFNLLYAFPLLLLSDGSGVVADIARPVGWAFTLWGTALYWWAGVLYVVQVRQLVRADRADGEGTTPLRGPLEAAQPREEGLRR
jgi:CDP-diacylglycerol--glycerol-3-phosphate 3-phosphatidyltransferase